MALTPLVMFTVFPALNLHSKFTFIGVLKNHVCHNNPRNFEKFRAEIAVIFGSINENILAATFIKSPPSLPGSYRSPVIAGYRIEINHTRRIFINAFSLS
jgi:hypothetical protein